MNKWKLLFYVAILIVSTTAHAYSEMIPPNIWEFTDDYYNVFGEPQLSVSVVGDPEYDSGDTSTVFIQLMNEGLVFGFETDEDPSNADETIDAQLEFDLEYDVTTAINIRGTLENEAGAPLRVISGLQQAGSLRSGETSSPMEFEVEFFNNAPAGTYELTLNLTFQYQYDVKVEGYPEPEYNYWYITRNQTLPVQIKVKSRADFEIVKTGTDIRPGEQGILYVTYRNVGSEIAEDAVARISLVDPFSTTDDQAFLGTLKTGDSYEAQYRITVDNDALPKSYGINTEVKYRDARGDTQISDVMKASFTVKETVPLSKRIGIAGFLVIAIVLVVIGIYIFRKRARK